MKHPIDNIQWIHARKLRQNAWNPNMVMSPEMRLLEESIMRSGWLQPVVVSPDYLIIDGYHRCWLALHSERVKQRDAEEVPCTVLDLPEHEAMMMTVRLNRAKGSHGALKMSALVQALHNDLGVSKEDIMRGIGASKEEVELLLAGTVLKARNLADYKYSKAWVPIETRQRAKVESFEREE